MKNKSREVYLVSVKDKHGYTTLKRVFSDKEKATREMYEALAFNEITNRWNIRNGSQEELEESKQQYIKQLKETFKVNESGNSTEYVLEDTMLYGTKREPVNIVHGRIIGTEVE